MKFVIGLLLVMATETYSLHLKCNIIIYYIFQWAVKSKCTKEEEGIVLTPGTDFVT